MIGLWVTLALVGDAARAGEAPLAGDASTLQTVHELEWSRAQPLTVASQAPGGGTDVREAVAVALGRLRSPDALAPLRGLRDDREPTVRRAVAAALGATPGAADEIRSWLDEVQPASSPAARALAEDGVRVRLLEALGRQGDAADVPRLVDELARPWPDSAAAARALGRMGRREVEGIEAAVGPLVRALQRPDPRLVEDVAWALRSIGLDGAEPELVRAARAVATDGPTGPTRASLVRAVWPALDPGDRAALFVRAATDPWRGVRVAAFDALRPDDLPADVVGTWLADADPWLADAALSAVGRIAETGEGLGVLDRVVEETDDTWVRAAALAKGATWGVSDSDPVVLAARVRRVDDRERLVETALTAPDPRLRSAALETLDSLGHDTESTVATGQRLLASDDPVVREVAVGWIGEADDAEALATLLTHLRTESDGEVLAAGLALVGGIAERGEARVDPADDRLLRALRRALAHPTARVRRVATDLEAQLGVDLEAPAPPPERPLVLPSGESRPIPATLPQLGEVAPIRSARVTTSRGAFTIALDPDTAPLAVANFALLAEQDFFDGLPFHRVVPDFVVQTGCPRGDGWGGPGWTIPDEPSALPFDVGAVGMARADHDTGGSQWFVVTGRAPHLSGEYTRFGEVTQGLEVVTRLRRGDRVLDVVIEGLDGGAHASGGDGGAAR